MEHSLPIQQVPRDQVAEQLAGKEVSVDVNVVPGCVYTDPEIASVGITEDEAKEKGIAVKVGKFIMSAMENRSSQKRSGIY